MTNLSISIFHIKKHIGLEWEKVIPTCKEGMYNVPRETIMLERAMKRNILKQVQMS